MTGILVLYFHLMLVTPQIQFWRHASFLYLVVYVHSDDTANSSGRHSRLTYSIRDCLFHNCNGGALVVAVMTIPSDPSQYPLPRV